MKVSKRDALILIGFVGILAAVLSYLLVFQPYMEKADALEQDNLALQARIADLSGKMANKETYRTQTEQMNQEMQEIYQLFPVDVREEDAILLAINQELLSPLDIDSIAIDPLEEVPFLDNVDTTEDVEYTYEIDEVEELEAQEGTSDPVTADTADTSGTGSGYSPYGLYDRKMAMNYEVSYDGLKRSIKNLCMQSNRTGIDSVSVVYNEETGLLTGSTSVSMYCVPNQEGKEYVEPDFSSVLLGTDNIFGTITIQSEAGLDDLEGEEEADEVQE
jgi:hypothetical protein